MNPILVQIGPLIIYKYGFLLTLAVLAGAYWIWKEAKKEGFDEEKILDLILIGLVGGILGGRLFYALFNLNYFKGYYLDILKFWQPGSMWYGAFIGGFLAVSYFVGRQKWSIFKIGDIAMPALTLGQAIGSFACLYGACAIPTQWYEMGLYLLPFAAFLILCVYRHPDPEHSGEGSLSSSELSHSPLGKLGTTRGILRRFTPQNDKGRMIKLPTGAIFFSLLAYFSLVRFVIMFFRWERAFVWRADFNQVISVAFFVYAVIGLKRLGLLEVFRIKQLALGLGGSEKKSMERVTKLPKSFLDSVKKTLSREERGLKKREKQLEKGDPYMEPGRDIYNAELASEVTENVGHEIVQTVMGSVRGMRREIQKALARIRIGKYGICESCGQAIDKARLRAFPAAVRCAKCAQREEEKKKGEHPLKGTRRMQ